MRKIIGWFACVILLFSAMLFAREYIADAKAKHAPATNQEAETQPLSNGEEAVTAALAVLNINESVHLGRVSQNPDGPGIRIVIDSENGPSTTYVFEDVAIDSWYADAVNFAVSAGLMTGVSADQPVFHPEYGIMRESVAMILYRFANGQPAKPRYSFSDVVEGEWYYNAVNWAANQQYMTALESSEFGIGKYMTVEHALICIYRLAGEPDTDATLMDYPYAMKVSDAGRNAVSWAWENGLITEVECVWYPTQAISRAQIALLLMRYSIMASRAV